MRNKSAVSVILSTRRSFCDGADTKPLVQLGTGTGELYEKAFGCHCANHRHRFPSSCPGGGGLHRHLRRISMQPVESNAGSLVRLSPSRRRGPVVNASVKTPDVDAIAIARRILV